MDALTQAMESERGETILKSYNMIFIGNNGVGKKSLAKLIAELLYHKKKITSPNFSLASGEGFSIDAKEM